MSVRIPTGSRAFIADHLTNLDPNSPAMIEDCPICTEDISVNHLAAQVTGIANCHHVFGRQCLIDWLRSDNHNNNKCPMRRTRLFRCRRQPRAEQPGQGQRRIAYRDADTMTTAQSERRLRIYMASRRRWRARR
ncbi:uncharacterized protein BDZ99DRAFT_561031 [Mytilinidion resinicola]|uniref:RING-type domain-containing protein n=1 Tax=Mytilinidion resinicola TaxID=574789 RepID=A0A6A6YQA8_9PEZI|nr:uncharacterized protein BDZ99DRAFT_561031 [Mytilinidion resinicola]KAF2810699.1 hypothetical protein BDZ99DRAFT_561031 [Mytilinidion resinicola]